MFYGIPHKECDVCSVMQETGRGFFFKVWFTTNNIKKEKISTLLPLATKTKCLFDVKIRLLYSDMGLDLREHIHRIILH